MFRTIVGMTIGIFCWPSMTVAVLAQSPVLTRATAIKESLARNQSTLQHTQLAMRQKITAVEGNLSPVFTAIAVRDLAALRPVIQEMRALGKELLGKKKTLDDLYNNLRSELKDSPAVFAAAGQACRAYAAEEPYPELKADYTMLAELWEGLAAGAENQGASIDSEQAQVAYMMKYLERTDLYLERLDAQLAALPKISGGAGKDYLEMLRKYVEKFETLRSVLWGIHERVGPANGTQGAADDPQITYSAKVIKVQPYLGEAVLDLDPRTRGLRPVMPLCDAQGALKGMVTLRNLQPQVVVGAPLDVQIGDQVLFSGPRHVASHHPAHMAVSTR